MSGFFVLVFAVYVIINLYLFMRLYQSMAGCGAFRAAVCFTLLVFAASFPAGRLLDGKLPEGAARAVTAMGSLYLSPMLYGLIFTVAADIFRLLNSVFAITHNPPPYPLRVRLRVTAAIIAASLLVTMAGVLNANAPVVINRAVTLGGGSEIMKIALLSDIHLGGFKGAKYLKKLVELTNAQFPDIVLLAGDTVDSAYFFKDADNVRNSAEILSSFQSRYGTWAVLGNHDHYAGAGDSAEFLSRAGVMLLRDEATVIGGKVILAGRDDRASAFSGTGRKSLEEILSAMPVNWDGETPPVIVIDHQPFGLDEAERAGAALQLSGHTHRGQLWPISFIVSLLYEKSYGEYKRGRTNYVITSGAGVWGPPVRTAGRPEIVIISLRDNEGGAYKKWELQKERGLNHEWPQN